MEANRRSGPLKPAFHGRGAAVLARSRPSRPYRSDAPGSNSRVALGSLRHCSNVAGLELLPPGVGIGSPSGFEGRWVILAPARRVWG